MTGNPDDAIDRLWKEYGELFEAYDDLTLARWMSQTLGQISGRILRYSHPIIGAYRMAAIIGQDRSIWHKRLVAIPPGYVESECCRAPVLPLFTREIADCGLICEHCNETLVKFEDMPNELKSPTERWANDYDTYHDVAHWSDAKRKACTDYQVERNAAANVCRQFLAKAVKDILPAYLDHYPVLLWEDQDECLDIKPEEIEL
jgi:hypothetical protein